MGSVNLPASLDNLRTLQLAWRNGLTLKLPTSLPNLTNLTLEGYTDATFELPQSLTNLVSLTLLRPTNEVTSILPKHLPEVTYFTIGEIGYDRVSQSLSKKDSTLTINVSTSFNGLKNLTVPSLYIKCLNLSGSMDNLTTLIIEEINHNCTLGLPDSLPNLKNLVIQNIESGTSYKLPAALPNLINLTLGDLDRSTIQLPSVLNKLTNLTFGKIDGIGYDLPVSLPNLSSVKIAGFQAILITSPEGHKQFSLNNIPSPGANDILNFLHAINKRINLPANPEVNTECTIL